MLTRCIKLRTSNLAGIFTGSIGTKPFKILEKRECVRIQGLPKFFWIPPIISGMFKATNFKLGGCIHRVHANKSPLKIWENRERGRIQGLPNFLKYPLLSQEWVKVRTSNLADTGWAKKTDHFWTLITLQRLAIERRVICQKFANFVLKKSIKLA